MRMKFTSVVFQGEKIWVAKCVELGVVSQGKTPEEAQGNLKEAVALYLEEDSDYVPRKSTVHTFEVEYAT